MKKYAVLMLVAVLAGMVQAEKFVTRSLKPNSSNVAIFTNDFANIATPVIIYTEVDGTTTNAVTMTYVPTVATNKADYGKTYIVGSFSTVGGAEVPIVVNDARVTNNAANVIVPRDDLLKLTGGGGVANTSVWYRIVFKVE